MLAKPLVANTRARIKENDNRPPRGLAIISTRVDLIMSSVVSGRILSINPKSKSWKLFIGMNGINVKKARIIGKMARKKLNEMEEARTVTELLNNPLIKKFATL
jgi:hypothetical protein